MSFTDSEDETSMPGPSRENYDYGDGEVNVDNEVRRLLESLQMDKVRRRRPTDDDDDLLRRVHEQIRDLIRREGEEGRRRRFRKALLPANCVREEVYNLRRTPPNSQPSRSYFPRLNRSLTDIVNDSFDEEYRKVAIVLGLVDALAELIVLEVHVHGTMPRLGEHRPVRKLIANALTNLTYGNAPSKKRLCSYSEFIPTVVRIFNEAKNLAQVYAGLIRNLSWMADSEMTASLLPCVQSLAAAAVEARRTGGEDCLRASLSALWNLASHSNESRRAICDEPGCLHMLATVLTADPNKTVEIESASGILKYVSQYLANTSTHIEERTNLVKSLVQHLSSSSFTVLCNVLGALSNMIAKDPHLQAHIRSNPMAMHQLNSLRDSARDDVCNHVKTVLNFLNQPSGYHARYGKMSSSVGVGSPYDTSSRDASRLLPLRAVRASPGAPSPMAMHQLASPFMENQRCASLPRHFARGGGAFAASVHGQTHHQQQQQQSAFASPSHNFHTPPLQQQKQQNVYGVAPPEFSTQMPEIDVDEDELDRCSAQCNRSNASRHSLESELPSSGWNSILESVNTSTNLSPVSPSDLPASPTHYTIMKMQQEAEELRQNGQQPLSLTVVHKRSGESDGSRHGGSDAATAIVEDYPTPTYPQMNNTTRITTNPAATEGDYAVLDTMPTENDLLERSIESALPIHSTPRTTRRQKSPMDGDHLLAETIQSAMPQPQQQSKRNSPRYGGDRFLMDCIREAMPDGEVTTSTQRPKNENGGRSCTVTQAGRRPLPGHQLDSDGLIATSVLFSTSQVAVRDANLLLKPQESADSSEDSDDCFGADEEYDVDTTLPLDCLEEGEEMTIDCSVLSDKSKKSSIAKPSRLPKPTKIAPRTTQPPKPLPKPKPQTQAVVSPYNYQKPKETTPAAAAEKPSPSEAKPVVHSGANTMLVTTV